MDKKSLVDALKRYKEDLIISRLSFRILDPEIPKDNRTLRIIASYDKTKTFAGDDAKCFSGNDDYLNFGMYYGSELIGYMGYRYSNPKDMSRYMIAIIIKEKYQKCGVGDIAIKQLINTLFTGYAGTKSIYAVILEDNIASRKLAEKNGFNTFKGYRKNDFITVNNEEKRTAHYLYTIRDFKRNKNSLRRYRTMKIN